MWFYWGKLLVRECKIVGEDVHGHSGKVRGGVGDGAKYNKKNGWNRKGKK